MIDKVSYNLKEAVAATGICRTTLYELMGSGELPFSQVRGKRYVLKSTVVDLLQRNRAGA